MYTNHETKNYESQQHVLIASSWRFNFTCNKKMGGVFFCHQKKSFGAKTSLSFCSNLFSLPFKCFSSSQEVVLRFE